MAIDFFGGGFWNFHWGNDSQFDYCLSTGLKQQLVFQWLLGKLNTIDKFDEKSYTIVERLLQNKSWQLARIHFIARLFEVYCWYSAYVLPDVAAMQWVAEIFESYCQMDGSQTSRWG